MFRQIILPELAVLRVAAYEEGTLRCSTIYRDSLTRFLYPVFFYQSVPSGPMRPFSIMLCLFHVVIPLFIRLPGVSDTGVWSVAVFQCLRHHVVTTVPFKM